MSASALSPSYTLAVSELSYPIGFQATAAQMEADERMWRTRLAEVMTVTDKWLANQAKDGHLIPAELTLGTAMVEAPRPTQAGGKLARPTLIAIPTCVIESRSFAVSLRVVLKVLPPPDERAALSKSLCAFIAAAANQPAVAHPLAMISPVRAERGALALSLTDNFYVPASWLPTVNQMRADFFKQASEVMLRSCKRFATEHPGVTVGRVAGLGTNAVRFAMEAPLGSFDLLTETFVVPGVPQPSNVALKNTLYEDWRAAGLPMQVELPALLK
jgi:hypothetical protein